MEHPTKRGCKKVRDANAHHEEKPNPKTLNHSVCLVPIEIALQLGARKTSLEGNTLAIDFQVFQVCCCGMPCSRYVALVCPWGVSGPSTAIAFKHAFEEPLNRYEANIRHLMASQYKEVH
jgi:hypothetical protein